MLQLIQEATSYTEIHHYFARYSVVLVKGPRQPENDELA